MCMTMRKLSFVIQGQARARVQEAVLNDRMSQSRTSGGAQKSLQLHYIQACLIVMSSACSVSIKYPSFRAALQVAFRLTQDPALR